MGLNPSLWKSEHLLLRHAGPQKWHEPALSALCSSLWVLFLSFCVSRAPLLMVVVIARMWRRLSDLDGLENERLAVAAMVWLNKHHVVAAKHSESRKSQAVGSKQKKLGKKKPGNTWKNIRRLRAKHRLAPEEDMTLPSICKTCAKALPALGSAASFWFLPGLFSGPVALVWTSPKFCCSSSSAYGTLPTPSIRTPSSSSTS